MKPILTLVIGIFLVLFLSISYTSAADFTPQGNISLRGIYAVINAAFINTSGTVNASGFYDDGVLITPVNVSFNQTLTDILYIGVGEEGNLNVNHSTSTTFWASVSQFVSKWFYDSGNVLTFNETQLNISIDNRGDTLNVNRSNFWDALDTVADILGSLINNDLNWWNSTQIRNYYFNKTEVDLMISGNLSEANSNIDGNFTELDNSKLDKTDQRYNETDLIEAVNTTLNIEGLGFVTGSHTTDTRWIINETVLKNESGILGINQTFWDNLYLKITDFFTKGTSGEYIYNDSTTIFSNDTKLNQDFNQTQIILDNNDSWTSIFNATYEAINTTDNIEGLGFNITTDLTSYYDERYLDSQLSLYFYNTSDSFNNSYTIMNTTLSSGEEQRDTYTSLSDGDNLLTKRILSTLQLSLLQIGAYDQHTTIDYTSGSKDLNLKSELYILYSNGTETLIGLSPVSGTLTSGTYQQVIWTGAINTETVFDTGDYLTMYLYAVVSGAGGAPTIDLVVGNKTAARLDIGINPLDIQFGGDGSFNITYDSYFINSSWNETHADKIYILQSEEENLNVNDTDFWDGVDSFNTTQMEDAGGILNILPSWFSTLFNTLFGAKDTDDLSEGSINFYDNRSFNETLTDALYADISIDGTVTSIQTTAPISGGEITTTGTISLTACSDEEIYKYNSTSGAWECSADTGGAVDYTNLAFTNISEVFDLNLNVSGNLTIGSGTSYMDIFYDGTRNLFDTLGFNALFTDNITADFFIGDGSLLTGISGDNETWNQDLADLRYREDSWDNFTGIPTATPSNGDTTHFSTANQIFDWAVGLFISTEVDPVWTANYSVRTGTGNVVFSDDPTFTTGITVPANSISDDEINEGDTFEWTAVHSWTAAVDFSGDVEFNDEIRPDNVLCDNGDILYKTGADNWDCKTVIEAGAGDFSFPDFQASWISNYSDIIVDTFNDTYDLWNYNQSSWLISIYEKWWYNQTVGANAYADATFAPIAIDGTVTSITAGNGLDFSEITATGAVTMGTPSALSGTTTDGLTSTSHTHSITSDDSGDCAAGVICGGGHDHSNRLANVVEDTAPQLGGYLDTNGNNIGSTSDEIENIYIALNQRVYFGNTQEASIYYDGSQLIIEG